MPENAIKRRKKVCPGCGRYLYLGQFYIHKSGKYKGKRFARCKDCEREKLRNCYKKNKKVPDGITFDSDGRKMFHQGLARRIYWDGNMISIMKRYFPTTLNKEMVELFDVPISERAIIRKARELGLQKDPQWLKDVWNERRYLAQASSRKNGNKGMFKPGRKFTGNQYTGKINP